MLGLDRKVVAEVLAIWGLLELGDLQGSMVAVLPEILAALYGAQEAAAALGARAAEATVSALGVAAGPRVVAAGFSGTASDGRSMASLVAGPMLRMAALSAGGAPTAQVRTVGGSLMERLVVTQLHDTSRASSGVIITANRRVKGHERVVESGACGKCIILSGRIYRWSEGFKRHDNCRCTMRPATDPDFRSSPSPEKIFEDMSEAEQNQAFGTYRAQAIRDGADLNQVVNSARQGAMSEGGLVTSEGTTRRGFASSARREFDRQAGLVTQETTSGRGRQRQRRTGPRLTPQAIYKFSNNDRDLAIEMLRRNGYIMDRSPRVRRAASAPAVQL